jgi:adenylate kinase
MVIRILWEMPTMSSHPYAALVLIGPPAMGKGTAATFLSERYNVPIVTPGNIYARIREEDSEQGQQVRDALKDGGLCPDWMTNALVAHAVLGGVRRAILDGYPRSLAQLEYLQNNYDVGGYLHIESDYNRGVEASESRRQCPVCDRVFTLRVPESACACTSPSEWKVRWDDTPDLYQKRWNTYQEQSAPVVERISSLVNYFRVDLLAEGWPAFERLLETRFTTIFAKDRLHHGPHWHEGVWEDSNLIFP